LSTTHFSGAKFNMVRSHENRTAYFVNPPMSSHIVPDIPACTKQGMSERSSTRRTKAKALATTLTWETADFRPVVFCPARTFSWLHNTYLRDQPVEVGVSGTLDVQRPAADVVDGLVVKQHSNIGVLQKRVSGQDTVVGLHNSS
jgi:hypothetical protein